MDFSKSGIVKLMSKQKGFAPISILGISLVLFVVVAGGWLFSTNRSLESKNNQLEKDLIFYKNTDLGKEVEILKLKLDAKDKDLSETKKSLDASQDLLNKLQPKVKTIPKITEVLLFMMQTKHNDSMPCYSETDKTKTKQALTNFGDSKWTELWDKFISDVKPEQNCTSSPALFKQAVDYGLNKILENSKY